MAFIEANKKRFFWKMGVSLSISTFIDKMIQTNLAFANAIWKHMIIKNLDCLCQNVFTESKASQKHSSNCSNRAKFLLSFCNTRCNKIDHMAALIMDLVLITINKSAPREMFVTTLQQYE